MLSVGWKIVGKEALVSLFLILQKQLNSTMLVPMWNRSVGYGASLASRSPQFEL